MGGTITLTATDIADFPVCADDVTVNGGVTVRSTGGDVVLQAGDDINLLAGSVVQADVGGVCGDACPMMDVKNVYTAPSGVTWTMLLIVWLLAPGS